MNATYIEAWLMRRKEKASFLRQTYQLLGPPPLD
jgi:hypothetical protein